MQISQEDDAQIIMFSQESNIRFSNQQNTDKIENKSKSKIHIYYIIAICAIIAAFYFLNNVLQNRQVNQPNHNQQIQSKQIVELSKQIEKLQKSGSSSRERINELNKKIQMLSNSNFEKKQKINTIASEPKNIQQNSKSSSKMMKVAEGTVSEINYLMQNQQGYGIEGVLYNRGDIEMRIEFHRKRIDFLQKRKDLQSLILATFNNKLDEESKNYQQIIETEQYMRLDERWSFKDYVEELPMCVVVPGYNNNKKFRIQYNLNSIFHQNYSNYFVVIVDDGSTDGSNVMYEKYLSFYKIGASKHILVRNNQRKTAVQNIYNAVRQYCDRQSIVVNVDGDDELIGKNVLKVFNAAYQKLKAGVIYSNFYFYEQGISVMQGFTTDYLYSEKRDNLYRGLPLKFSHLMSFRAELFLKIDEKDFKDENGNFYRSAYNLVLYFPLMESACGRVYKIEGMHYLYNTNTGLNDDLINRQTQVGIEQKVRTGVRYGCDQQFRKKMERNR